MAEILVPLAFFGFLGAVILGPIWLRERTKQANIDLISRALEKGQPLDPELVRQITATQQVKPPADRARRTLGSGIVLLGLAVGFAAAAMFSHGFDPSGAAQSGMMVPATILGALGIAFTLLAIVDYSTKKKEE